VLVGGLKQGRVAAERLEKGEFLHILSLFKFLPRWVHTSQLWATNCAVVNKIILNNA